MLICLKFVLFETWLIFPWKYHSPLWNRKTLPLRYIYIYYFRREPQQLTSYGIATQRLPAFMYTPWKSHIRNFAVGKRDKYILSIAHLIILFNNCQKRLSIRPLTALMTFIITFHNSKLSEGKHPWSSYHLQHWAWDCFANEIAGISCDSAANLGAWLERETLKWAVCIHNTDPPTSVSVATVFITQYQSTVIALATWLGNKQQ